MERYKLEFNEAQEISLIGSWYLDFKTNQISWTEGLSKMFGFDPTLPVPPYTEHMKLFTPESWELLSTSLEKTKQTGIPYELKLQTVRKDGKNGWMWVRGETVKDSNGNTIALMGIAQDISERKQKEQALLQSNKQLRLINEFSTEILEKTDLKGIYEFLAHKLSELFPNTAILCNSIDEEKNEAILESISGINSNILKKIIAISGFNPVGKKFELVHSHNEFLRTGKLQLFQKGLVDFSVGEYPTFAAIAIEKLIGISNIYSIGISKGDNLIASIQFFSYNKSKITEKEFIETFVSNAGIIIQKKIVELQHTESEERFRAMFEQSNAVKLIIDPKTGNIEDANAAALKFYGHEKIKLCNMRISDINQLAEYQVKEEMELAKNKGKTYFEFKHLTANNQIKDVVVYSSPIKFGDSAKLLSLIWVTHLNRMKFNRFVSNRFM